MIHNSDVLFIEQTIMNDCIIKLLQVYYYHCNDYVPKADRTIVHRFILVVYQFKFCMVQSGVEFDRYVFRFHYCFQSVVSLNFHQGWGWNAMRCIVAFYSRSMWPALNGNSEIQCFECSNAIKMHGNNIGIIHWTATYCVCNLSLYTSTMVYSEPFTLHLGSSSETA